MENTELNDDEYLKSIYFSPSHPASYGGVDKIYKFIKQEGDRSISRNQIKKWLSGQRVYNAHKSVKRKFKRQRVIAASKFYQFDGDTINMQRYEKENKGYKHILILIDVFTRFTMCAPMKDLSGKSSVGAFKKIFKDVRFPSHVRTDKGTEFTNNLVKRYFRENKIEHFFAHNTEIKANYAERVIKTLKSKMTKIMDRNQSHQWIDILQDVTRSYNNTVHRSIKMTPRQALNVEDTELWDRLYVSKTKAEEKIKPKAEVKTKSKVPRSRSSFKFKVGDKVQLSFLKHSFSREYDEKWTGEIFFITSRLYKQTLPLYTIKDWNNDPIVGTFYESELQKVYTDQNTKFNVERTIKKRVKRGVKEVLVKWQGWRDAFNTWVPESEVTPI